jgi:hypothetical protein
MKKLLPAAIAASVLIGACATTETSNQGGAPSAKAAKEDYVTGSRIPRSESNENYQGAKSITGQDYQDYLGAVGKKSN